MWSNISVKEDVHNKTLPMSLASALPVWSVEVEIKKEKKNVKFW